MTSHVVVAHYGEDLGWLGAAAEAWPADSVSVFVYSKAPVGEPLPTLPALHALPTVSALQRVRVERRPNVGREAETWLHHVTERFGDLPETVYFLQGDPFDHVRPRDRAALRAGALPAAVPGTPTPIFADEISETSGAQGVDHASYHALLFDAPVPARHRFAPGAQYAVRREDILAKPLGFYLRLAEMLRASPHVANRSAFPYAPGSIDPWSVERMWPGIFAASVRPRPEMTRP